AAVKDRLEQGRERLRNRLSRRGVLMGTALTSAWLLEATTQAVGANLAPHVLAKTAPSIAAGQATFPNLLPAWPAEPAKGATTDMFIRNMALLAAAVLVCGLAVATVATGLPGPGQPMQQAAVPLPAGIAPTSPAPEQARPKKLAADTTSVQPESVPLTGHKGKVHSATFSPDAKTVATAGADGTVRFWDPATGQQTGKFEQPVELMAVAYGPDGRSLVTTRKDGVLVRFDLNGKALWSSGMAGGGGGALALSPDGRRIVAGSAGGVVDMFDALTGKILFRFKGQDDGGMAGGAFSPGGENLVRWFGGNRHPPGWPVRP